MLTLTTTTQLGSKPTSKISKLSSAHRKCKFVDNVERAPPSPNKTPTKSNKSSKSAKHTDANVTATSSKSAKKVKSAKLAESTDANVTVTSAKSSTKSSKSAKHTDASTESPANASTESPANDPESKRPASVHDKLMDQKWKMNDKFRAVTKEMQKFVCSDIFSGEHYVVELLNQENCYRPLLPRVAFMAMAIWIAHVFHGDFGATGLALDLRWDEEHDADTMNMLLLVKLDHFIQGFIGHEIWLECSTYDRHYQDYLPDIICKALDVLCFYKKVQLTTRDQDMKFDVADQFEELRMCLMTASLRVILFDPDTAPTTFSEDVCRLLKSHGLIQDETDGKFKRYFQEVIARSLAKSYKETDGRNPDTLFHVIQPLEYDVNLPRVHHPPENHYVYRYNLREIDVRVVQHFYDFQQLFELFRSTSVPNPGEQFVASPLTATEHFDPNRYDENVGNIFRKASPWSLALDLEDAVIETVEIQKSRNSPNRLTRSSAKAKNPDVAKAKDPLPVLPSDKANNPDVAKPKDPLPVHPSAKANNPDVAKAKAKDPLPVRTSAKAKAPVLKSPGKISHHPLAKYDTSSALIDQLALARATRNKMMKSGKQYLTFMPPDHQRHEEDTDPKPTEIVDLTGNNNGPASYTIRTKHCKTLTQHSLCVTRKFPVVLPDMRDIKHQYSELGLVFFSLSQGSFTYHEVFKKGEADKFRKILQHEFNIPTQTKYAEDPTQKIMASYTGGNNHVTIDYLPMSLFEVSKFMSIVNVTPDLSDPAVSVSLQCFSPVYYLFGLTLIFFWSMIGGRNDTPLCLLHQRRN